MVSKRAVADAENNPSLAINVEGGEIVQGQIGVSTHTSSYYILSQPIWEWVEKYSLKSE